MNNSLAAVVMLGALGLAACESESTKGKTETTPKATASAAASASVSSTVTPVVAKPERSVRRPKNRAELVLTDHRRAAVEKALPEANGFLDLVDLEQSLFKKDLTRGKVEGAVKVFDRLAKGKWVLFVGNIGKQEGDSFELAVRYTARDPKDPFGLTANWFPVTFKAVKGYEKSDYRAGELMTVLAKYDGKQQASEGRDLVMLKVWDFTPTK